MSKFIKIRYIIVICFLILFAWWAYQAIVRYWSQPLTTDISYKFGDQENGIEFPIITFCPYLIVTENPVLNECYNGSSWSFITALYDCLKNNKNFDIDSFMTNLQIDQGSLRATALFWTGVDYISLNNLEKYLWSALFHPFFGPCYSFDLSNAKEFEFIQYQGNNRPLIEFILTESLPWKNINVILHSNDDFPDAWIMHGYLQLPSISNKMFKAFRIKMRKKVSKRESTENVPCTQYDQETCKNIEDNKRILNTFNCRMPILYQGHYLDHLFSDDIPLCDNSLIEQALDLIMEERCERTRSQRCEWKEYFASLNVEETYRENKTLVTVLFETPKVEYHNTYISYDLLSLIGEVGGILGLTIGASGMTLFDLILQYLPYY